MSYTSIVYEKRGWLCHLRLARPQAGNAVGYQMLQELADVCQRIGDDEEVRAVILSGQGDVFCQGWEQAELTEALRSPATSPLLRDSAFSPLAELSRPVIGAINGDAISAGLELALACDVRIACPEAHFALPETSWGIIPLGGGTQRLPRIVGRARALALILTAETIDAQEAHRIGLVSQVVPRQRLLEEAEALAGRIAQRGPIAVRYAKEAVLRGLEMPLEQALRYETDLTIILQTTQDRAEGVRAFLEKRPPRFTGH